MPYFPESYKINLEWRSISMLTRQKCWVLSVWTERKWWQWPFLDKERWVVLKALPTTGVRGEDDRIKAILNRVAQQHAAPKRKPFTHIDANTDSGGNG